MAERTPRVGLVRPRNVPLRLRITALVVLVVGLALDIGSVILVQLLHSHLVDSSRSSAETRAGSLVSLLKATPDLDRASLGDDDDEFVQILDRGGRVVVASENVAGEPAVRLSDDDDDAVDVDGDPYVVVRERLETSAGRRTVVTGSSLEAAHDATGSLSKLLAVGVPAMLLLVGATTWLMVGRTLAPVDRIRREADEISATQLHRRLPEPERQDEIGRLAHTMNLMLDRLDQAQQQQRRFVSDAAHELRSPIASIKQNAEVASTYPDHLSSEELVDTVLVESTRLERLVTALLGLARLDERAPDSTQAAVDLDDLVFEEARRLRRTTSLRIDTTAVSAGRVAGEEALFSQVLRNLVDNAERHARGTIALALSEQGSQVHLSVDDDGPGIPEEDRERVFERFVRLDEARARDDGGSGLGLAIVHDIVTACGGSVAVTGSHLGGASLSVILPCLVDSA